MRVPQVSERIKEAPAQALRGVFAGIGQLLLITDKLRNKTPAGQQVPRARTPESTQTRTQEASPTVSPASAPPTAAAAPTAAVPEAPPAPEASSASAAPSASSAEKAPEARDFDKTGNVRLLTSREAAASAAPTADATVAVTEEDSPMAAGKASPAAEVEPGAPMPNYDGSSIASVRARLRNLDVAQLRQLIEYERAHAGRADFITMFERRIAKLQAETPAEARGAAAKVDRGEAEAEAEIEAREDVEAEVQEEVGAEAEGEE